MIIPMTEKEEKIWIKKHQILFVIKKAYKTYPENFMETLENSIFEKSDVEIEDLYKVHEEKIKKEKWVHYSPHYYHITEFDEALKSQLHIDLTYAPNEYFIEMLIGVKKFYEKVKKYNLSQLTLKQKMELYGLTHPLIY